VKGNRGRRAGVAIKSSMKGCQEADQSYRSCRFAFSSWQSAPLRLNRSLGDEVLLIRVDAFRYCLHGEGRDAAQNPTHGSVGIFQVRPLHSIKQPTRAACAPGEAFSLNVRLTCDPSFQSILIAMGTESD
jgi:hypothetical protein